MDTFYVPRVRLGDQDQRHDLVTESSDIGLPVGQWPRFIKVEGEPQTFCFIRFDLDHSGEDIAGARYESANGAKLLVIND